MNAPGHPMVDINTSVGSVLAQHVRDYKRIIRALETGELRPVTAVIAQLVDAEAGARHALITANAAAKRFRMSPAKRGRV